MGKYKYREGSYGYMESIGFESIRSMIDDEISNNKKTDEQQSEDIAQEGQERQTADEQFDERISALEDAISGSSEIEENFNEFTGTTYPADKEALESKDAELEAAIAEKADAAAVEEVQAAIDTLNGDGEGSVKKTAEDAAVAEVAKVVAEAPEDLDTLKEVADYIAADKTKASEIETKLSDHDTAIERLDAKDEELVAKDAELVAKDAELEAKDAELEAAIGEKADTSALENKADKTAVEALEATVADKADASALEREATRAQEAEETLDTKIDTKADATVVADELTALKNKDTELEAKDAAQDEEIAKKVEWVESTPGRNHIVLKNHDSILGTATDGTTYNVAMVSKWDVADFGTAQLHANLNSKDGVVTINDDKAIATKDEVEVVDAKVDAIDLEPYAKTADVNSALENKANASDLSALNTTVEELSSKVDEKALQSDLEALQTTVADKADATAMTAAVAAVEATVATKADATAVEALEATVATKADADTVYTKDEVDAMLAEKQAEIDAMKTEYAKLKDIVGDLGGAVEYSVPEDGTFNNMMKKSGIITLKEDVTTGTYAGGITSKNITTLKLGGKTLTFSGTTTNNPAIMARGTQQLTITGGGTLDAAGRIAIEANGADTVINLGGTMFGRPTYVTDRSGGELIYCYLGTINITEGVFKNNGADKTFMLNCYDANYQNGTAKIVVTGGKFYDFDPANNTAEGPDTSFVAEGYESVASTETIDGVEHTVYTVKKVS